MRDTQRLWNKAAYLVCDLAKVLLLQLAFCKGGSHETLQFIGGCSLAQTCTDCVAIAKAVLQVLRTANAAESATDHDGETSAERLTFLHAVRGDDNTTSLLSLAAQCLPQLPPGHRVHACGRLVKIHHRRITHQCYGCAQLALVTTTVDIERSTQQSEY